MGWRLIDDGAPTDGTRVLVAYLWKGAWVYRVSHMNRMGNWVSDPGEWQISPTHWQPLPAPPAQGDVGSAQVSRSDP